MIDLLEKAESPMMVLDGITAAELMTTKVVCVHLDATVDDTAAFLKAQKLHAVAVVDSAGEAIGVVSLSDIATCVCRRGAHLQPGQGMSDETRASSEDNSASSPGDVQRVKDIMTWAVYSVRPETPAKHVIQMLLSLGVHRLFVNNADGDLVGVISSNDMLRRLHEPVTLRCGDVEFVCADTLTQAMLTKALAAEVRWRKSANALVS